MPNYDVIVIGARCAGAPLAMLLARKGRRVDRRAGRSDQVHALMHEQGGAWGRLGLGRR